MSSLSLNPWTIAEREIIAEIVNEAIGLKLQASNVIGCVTDIDSCTVIWNGEHRQAITFALSWFSRRVKSKVVVENRVALSA
jgi:glycerol kinase